MFLGTYEPVRLPSYRTDLPRMALASKCPNTIDQRLSTKLRAKQQLYSVPLALLIWIIVSQRISLEVGMTTGLQNAVAFDWLRPNREVLSQRMILALLEMCDTVSSAL